MRHVPLSDLCRVTLHRTLRVPDDGGDYPLPPGLGPMPVHRISAGEFVVPMHRAEALWLGFDAPPWKPHALKVGAGRVDALTGDAFAPDALGASPQDYMVVPDQPWLDGINAGDGFVRQFVAVPLGEGLGIEAQLDDGDEEGGLRLSLFAPRPGRFPDEPPARTTDGLDFCLVACESAPMGLGAGGRIRQEIHEDAYGIDTWEPEPARTVRVDLVDALAFEALTGRHVPAPVDAETYTRYGLPWFDLLAPTARDIAASERLAGIRSVGDLEGWDDEPLPIPPWQVVRLLQLRATPV